jgi:hypothetical protein
MVLLAPEDVGQLESRLYDATLESLPKMAVPKNLETLTELDGIAAQRQAAAEHFSKHFDVSA